LTSIIFPLKPAQSVLSSILISKDASELRRLFHPVPTDPSFFPLMFFRLSSFFQEYSFGYVFCGPSQGEVKRLSLTFPLTWSLFVPAIDLPCTKFLLWQSGFAPPQSPTVSSPPASPSHAKFLWASFDRQSAKHLTQLGVLLIRALFGSQSLWKNPAVRPHSASRANVLPC